MLPKDTQIFLSFHPNEEAFVSPILEQIRLAGWHNANASADQNDRSSVLKLIQQSGMVLIFLSKTYAENDRLMLEEFAYAATVVRKSFILIWLDSLADIQQDYQQKECDRQLLSALEMLTAKHSGTTSGEITAVLEQYTQDNTPYTPSTPQICEKPCEAYEDNKPYIFISYAHDDAPQVYPLIKELYESGWDLWYDEGIKITERYLPVIAHHVNRCSLFVLMLTNRCLERPFVMNYELEYARKRGIPIIPVLLEKLNPQPWSMKKATLLENAAIAPDALLKHVGAVGLTNQGTRKAVPPAIKQNVVYDVSVPPELPGFKITVHGDEITIVRYVGNNTEVIIPSEVTSLDNNITFRVIAIDDFAFTGGGWFLPISQDVKKTEKNILKNCRLLKSVTVPDSVLSIGKYAFSGCKSLKNVTISNNVKIFEEGIFSGCKSLTNINFPAGIEEIGNSAFNNCKSLNNIVIPDSITIIKGDTFSGCKSLTNISIPAGIEEIGESAFYGCTSLKNIVIPDTVTNIGFSAFSRCKLLNNITIPNSVIKIGSKAFFGCKSLSDITLPDNIENIGDYAFSFCPQLGEVFNADKTILFQGPQKADHTKSYKIPDGVTKISGEAFVSGGWFTNMIASGSLFNAGAAPTSIVIPNSMTQIDDKAFQNNKTLKRVIIPNSITSIGEKAFSGCKSLRDIIISNSVTSIGENAFSGCISIKNIVIPNSVTSIGDSAFSNCKLMKKITISESVINIEDYAFKNCKSLRNVTIPNKVTSVSGSVFSGCKSLRSVCLPDGLENIKDSSFLSCKSLTRINIPNSVVSIGESAFQGCKSLKNIEIPDSVKHIGYKAFSNTPVENKIPERNLQEKEPEPEYEEEAGQQESSLIPVLPKSRETPRAYICCSRWDIKQVKNLLSELYWEGFNIYYNKFTIYKEINESQCILAFFSKKTAQSEQAIDKLKYAAQHDASRVIQVFLGDCTDWPDELRDKLHDRQAVIQSLTSEQEFTGKIRDSLRQFKCNLGRTRGFDVIISGDSVEITKFHPTDYTQVIIPRTFLNPPLPVVSIGTNAFIDCETITSVIIPDGVTNIKGGDISGAFMNCKSLKNITIPVSVTNIGGHAFYFCKSLTNIDIPDSVTNIGDGAFFGCESLKNITIPDSVTNIGDGAFSLCGSLTSVILPNGITTIKKNTFQFCASLQSVFLPNSVKTIKEGAFSSCTSLTNLTLPNGLKKIGNSIIDDGIFGVIYNYINSFGGAFSDCSSLRSITIPDSVSSISKNAFNNCRLLTIYANPNSYAWKYAKKYNIKCEPLDKSEQVQSEKLEPSENLTELDEIKENDVSIQRDPDITEDGLWDLMIYYGQMGDNHNSLKHPKEAVVYYLKSVEAGVKEYEQSGYSKTLNLLAELNHKIGACLVLLNNKKEAEDYYKNYIDWNILLFEKNGSDNNLSRLAKSFETFGGHLQSLNRHEEAFINFQKALEARERLYKKSGKDGALRDLAVTYNIMGNHLIKYGQSEEAVMYIRKAVGAFKQLYEQNGTSLALKELSTIYGSLAIQLTNSKQTEEAKEYYLKAIDIRKQLYEESGEAQALLKLSTAYGIMADHLTKSGQTEEAKEYHLKVIDAREQLYEKDRGTQALQKLSSSYVHMGNFLTQAGQIEGAEEYYLKAVDSYKYLYEQHDTIEILDDLIMLHDKIGDNKLSLGFNNEALSYHLKALELFEQLVKLDPSAQKRESYYRDKVK